MDPIFANIDTWLVDIDGTLYSNQCGLFDCINVRVRTFAANLFGLPLEQAAQITRAYYKEYGNTLTGLVKHHDVDPAEYLEFIHDLPVEEFVHPDPALANLLASLPGRRVVFTNASSRHALRVMAAAGIDPEIFHLCVDALDQLPFSKPDPRAFQRAMHLAQVTHPSRCALIDDSPANTRTAMELGMAAVLVGAEAADPDVADRVVPSLPGFTLAEADPCLQNQTAG